MNRSSDLARIVARARRRWGAQKTAARRIGVPLNVYVARRVAGERWCCAHRRWEPASNFKPNRRQCSDSWHIGARRDDPLSDREVTVMRDLRWIGRMPYHALSRMFGRSYRAVWAACNGETFTHLPMPRDGYDPRA